MKIEINLNDEPAFLSEIKNFIKDNVKSIARSEFDREIKNVFADKLQSALPKDLSLAQLVDTMLKQHVKTAIDNALQEGNTYDKGKSIIRSMIREEVTFRVKEMFDKKDL